LWIHGAARSHKCGKMWKVWATHAPHILGFWFGGHAESTKVSCIYISYVKWENVGEPAQASGAGS
jgi:hypothetical protein